MEVKSINREDVKINRKKIEINKMKEEKEQKLKELKEKEREERVKQSLYEFLSATIKNNKDKIIHDYNNHVSNIASIHGFFRTCTRMEIEEVNGFKKINFKHIKPFTKKKINEYEQINSNIDFNMFFHFNCIQDGESYHHPYLDSEDVINKLKKDINVWLEVENLTIRNLLFAHQKFAGVEYIIFYIITEYDFRTDIEKLEDEIHELKKSNTISNFFKKISLTFKLLLMKLRQKEAL